MTFAQVEYLECQTFWECMVRSEDAVPVESPQYSEVNASFGSIVQAGPSIVTVAVNKRISIIDIPYGPNKQNSTTVPIRCDSSHAPIDAYINP